MAELGDFLSSSGGTYCDVKENGLVSPMECIIVVAVVTSNYVCIKRDG